VLTCTNHLDTGLGFATRWLKLGRRLNGFLMDRNDYNGAISLKGGLWGYLDCLPQGLATCTYSNLFPDCEGTTTPFPPLPNHAQEVPAGNLRHSPEPPGISSSAAPGLLKEVGRQASLVTWKFVQTYTSENPSRRTGLALAIKHGQSSIGT
jgi:hypothetical protein